MSYEEEYLKFVDSKEPLSDLQNKDWSIYMGYGKTYPYLYDIPSKEREDFFDVRYGHDPIQTLDIHYLKSRRSKKRPVVFFIHGGGWNCEDKSNTRFYALDWINMGYTVVSINYRLAPHSQHPCQIEDCALALKWVIDNIRRYGGNPNKIVGIGHSAGAHLLALLVCGKQWHKRFDINIKKVKCWIPVSGIFDFNMYDNYLNPMLGTLINEMLGDGDKDNCSVNMHITGKEPPCLILHGGDDWLVPRSNSIALYDMLNKKGCCDVCLEIVKGYWHCNMMLGYDKPGHVPAQLINSYLEKFLTHGLEKYQEQITDKKLVNI